MTPLPPRPGAMIPKSFRCYFCNASYAAGCGLAISSRDATLSILGKDTSAWAGWSPLSPQQPHVPREARTENVTFIVHDQLYKRNIPTRARIRGPFHKRALEKARERARKRGQLGGVHEGHSVSHLA